MIIGNWTHSQVCSIMLVKTTQYKSSGISSANLLRALENFNLAPAISPELKKCLGSNPVLESLQAFPLFLISLMKWRMFLILLEFDVEFIDNRFKNPVCFWNKRKINRKIIVFYSTKQRRQSSISATIFTV